MNTALAAGWPTGCTPRAAAGTLPPAMHAALPAASPPDPDEGGLRPLWLQAQQGDARAYREALALIARRLRAYFRRRLGDRADEAEDLVQETLLALHLKRDSYDPAWPVGAWVLAIARHKLVDLWRRRGRHDERHASLDTLDEDEMPHAPAHAEAGEARGDLATLLQALPAAQRRAIELTKLQGLSVQEAAAQSGASTSAIKVQVHRGLKRLAQLVKGQPAKG